MDFVGELRAFRGGCVVVELEAVVVVLAVYLVGSHLGQRQEEEDEDSDGGADYYCDV